MRSIELGLYWQHRCYSFRYLCYSHPHIDSCNYRISFLSRFDYMHQMYKRAPCNLFHPKHRYNLVRLKRKIFIKYVYQVRWFAGVSYHHIGTALICKLDHARIDIAQLCTSDWMNKSIRRCCLHSHPFHRKQPNVLHTFKFDRKKNSLRVIIQKTDGRIYVNDMYRLLWHWKA